MMTINKRNTGVPFNAIAVGDFFEFEDRLFFKFSKDVNGPNTIKLDDKTPIGFDPADEVVPLKTVDIDYTV